MKLDDMGMAFPQECLRAALLISLLSVWVLVGLFYYLNHYARKDYFRILTGAWLFYAIWLTLSLGLGDAAPGSALFAINQSCVSISAVFLLWGSMRYLGLPIPRKLSAVLAAFLSVWILASPQFMKGPLQIHLPVFILLGLSSPFAGVCLLRLQKQQKFVGVGMLSLGFLLWVIYVGSYPFARDNSSLYSAGFFTAAFLQLLIAVSMVFVLFREVRCDARKVQAEIEAVRQERFKVITTKEACQHLYDRMRAAEQTETAMARMRKAQQTAAERQKLEALGQMAGDLAHDLNNALTPITAYSELLLSTLKDLPEGPRNRLERISSAAEDVAQIVAHMREFYRPAASAEMETTVSKTPRLDPDLPSAGACRPLRILCIDDEPELRQVMREVLELDNHYVTVAPGGKAGLDVFRACLHSGQPYEVVITDLGMPEVDGHHVARAVKAESPKTPIIMLTGWGTLRNSDGQPGSEVDAVLGKPPRKQELSNLLSQITMKNS